MFSFNDVIVFQARNFQATIKHKKSGILYQYATFHL